MAIFNSYVSLPEGRLISEASGHVWVTPELGADGGGLWDPLPADTSQHRSEEGSDGAVCDILGFIFAARKQYDHWISLVDFSARPHSFP